MAKRITDSRFVTLNNGLGLKGTFTSVGAGVYSLSLDGVPLILTPRSHKTYLNSEQFFGKTLGRVAGRIPCTLNLDYFSYKLNENEPGVCLHGGVLDSLSFKDFDSIIVTRPDATYIIFDYVSPDKEAGFPGNVKLTITYSFPHDENTLRIKYQASSDSATILSLSNHMYFNFGDESVENYKLQVNASKCGVMEKNSKLIERFKAVPEYLDFRDASVIKEKLPKSKSIDDTYLFDNIDSSIPQVVLESDKIKLECFTTYEAVNIYIDDSMSDVKFTNRVGIKRRAIAIEPQMSPITPFLLRPGVEYRQTVSFKFNKK